MILSGSIKFDGHVGNNALTPPREYLPICRYLSRDGKRLKANGTYLISGMVMRLMGSTVNMRMMRSRAPGDRWSGSLYVPDWILRNSSLMFLLSNGRQFASMA